MYWYFYIELLRVNNYYMFWMSISIIFYNYDYVANNFYPLNKVRSERSEEGIKRVERDGVYFVNIWGG